VTTLVDVPVALFGIGAGLGSDVALGLADQGAPIALLCHVGEMDVAERTAAVLVSEGRTATVVEFDPGSGASVQAAIAQAAARIGPVRAVVDITAPGTAATPSALSAVEESAWNDRVTVPFREALHRLQGSYRSLRTLGGRMVVVLPTLSLSGAAGMVPWTTMTEGYRAFTKVAARAWGEEGITVNCVAVPAGMLAGQPVAADSLDRPGLPPVSLGRLPDPRVDVAGAVAGLLGSDMSFVTGATLAVDGGVWMTP
jgi:NAD(P)-dependent dehydrogenase (short-subunit alcohol dehydrogenase family)